MSKDMKNLLKETALSIVLFIVACTLTLFLLAELFEWNKPAATEIRSYTVGYEVSHMEITKRGYYISGRNDTDSFSLRVDGKIFGRFVVGDIMEVEVKEMEMGEKIYNKYLILGVDK